MDSRKARKTRSSLMTDSRSTRSLFGFLVETASKNQNKTTIRSMVQKVAKHPMTQPADL